MSLHYLNKDSHLPIARLMSAEGGLDSINGNFGRPFCLYAANACIALTPKETISLLSFLNENRDKLIELAKEQSSNA